MQIQFDAFLRTKLLIEGLQQSINKFSLLPFTYHEKTKPAIPFATWTKEVTIHTSDCLCIAFPKASRKREFAEVYKPVLQRHINSCCAMQNQ